MLFAPWVNLFLGATAVAATNPSRTSKRNSPFVNAVDSNFQLNGKNFKFVGTNAYWLPTLNSEADIDKTLMEIAAAGIKVVRTWAFNDVEKIPDAGVYFQLIQNGKTTINTGPNGIQRLDTVVKLAEKHGIFLHLALTNNWNPKRDSYSVNNPRNYLSNDYGGMDAYVRQFCDNPTHDQFYTKPGIIKAYSDYVTFIANRYKDSPNVFGWEIANDPRCFSTVNASPSCNPQVITAWHSTLAKVIRAADPNHLISSGNGGFFCVGCPKLFPRTNPPAPATSPAPGRQRRGAPITKADVIKQRNQKQVSKRGVAKTSKRASDADGLKIRGRWVSAPTKRQSSGLGSAFDGSQGVDNEDIINIPEIGFGTFQYFPEQNVYSLGRPPTDFNEEVSQGLSWIDLQGNNKKASGKPFAATAFGIVAKGHEQFFVPFNQTRPDNIPAYPASYMGKREIATPPDGPQLSSAFGSFFANAVRNGLNGFVQYQAGVSGLTTSPGTPIIPFTNTNGQSQAQNQNGQSPDDGYQLPVGGNGDQGVFQNGALAFGAN